MNICGRSPKRMTGFLSVPTSALNSLFYFSRRCRTAARKVAAGELRGKPAKAGGGGGASGAG